MSMAGDSRTDRSQHLHSSPPSQHYAGGKVPRRQFITDHLGLTHDPFQFEAAENEVQAYPDDFLAYFVVPDAVLWRRLLGAEHLVIFGAHGSGKTTLRLNAAYQLRRTPAPTMVVTCDFGGNAPADMPTFLAQQVAQRYVNSNSRTAQYGRRRRGTRCADCGAAEQHATWQLAQHPGTPRRTAAQANESTGCSRGEGASPASTWSCRRPCATFCRDSSSPRQLASQQPAWGLALPPRMDWDSRRFKYWQTGLTPAAGRRKPWRHCWRR